MMLLRVEVLGRAADSESCVLSVGSLDGEAGQVETDVAEIEAGDTVWVMMTSKSEL